MDWGNDYFTFSDTNIEYIWRFLADRPRARAGSSWATARPSGARAAAPRSRRTSCTATTRTALDPSLFVRFPLLDREGEWIVVWTTTPWTLPANVAAAVNPDAEYGLLENGDWVAVALLPGRDASRASSRAPSSSACATTGRSTRSSPGAEVEHRVIPWDDVALDTGTGHRPHRARLRRRGLRALEGARPRRARARRRGGPLLPRRTAGCTASRRSRRPSRSSATSATAACSSGRDGTSTATRSAGAATRR